MTERSIKQADCLDRGKESIALEENLDRVSRELATRDYQRGIWEMTIYKRGDRVILQNINLALVIADLYLRIDVNTSIGIFDSVAQ